ncbi:MAG TPA: MBL fold metallo-hydrolase [Adhaeribacter sp.]|nr:MBL fold metallo-hydrolase [Adhaeribacter sp.]
MERTDKNLIVETHDNMYAVADGVTGMKIVFVNIYFVNGPDGPGGSWVLVDAGLYGSSKKIKRAAEARFGKDARPSAIILTHGHFDHVGALKELAEEWNVPVYAHKLELPYLTGLSAYPPPDPTVGGGAMSYMSWMYPKKPIHLEGRVQPLPADGSVPGLPGWHWFHTPGHSPGHVSFFRESDRTLIAGDAVTTRKPESALAIMTDSPEVCGPPAYYTPDWQSAKRSAETIAKMRPKVIASGHGIPMRGERMLDELDELVQYFEQMAVPAHGRYVSEPAVTDEHGVVYVPQPVVPPVSKTLITAGLIAAAGLTAYALSRRNGRKKDTGLESPLDNHPYQGAEMNLSAYGEIPEAEEDALLRQNAPDQGRKPKRPAPEEEDFTGRNAPSNNYP